MLLRVGPYGTDAGYGTARHGWRIGQRWVDTTSPRSPRWAAVVVGDLVEAVYAIDAWEPSGHVDRPGRRAVVVRGVTRSRPRAHATPGATSAAYLGPGAPTPVTYVWCGPHWVNTAR